MGFETNVVDGLLEQIGAAPRNVQKFEGNKFLVNVDTSDRSGPDFFLKPIKKVDPLSREILRLRSSQRAPAEFSDLDGVAMLPIAHDERSGYISFQYFADSKPLKAVLTSEAVDRADLLARVAAALAGFHLKAAALLDGRGIQVCDIHSLWPDFVQPTIREYTNGPGADYPMLIRYIQSFEGFREAVARFRSDAFEPAICHGDFKFDNVLVKEICNEVRIIDFSDLVRYDRHYDLGVATSELISLWLAAIDYSDVALIAEAIDRVESKFQAEQQLIRHFLRSYAEAIPGLKMRADRVAYFSGRALIHNALGSLYLSNHLSRYHWACLHVGANMVENFRDFGHMFRPVE